MATASSTPSISKESSGGERTYSRARKNAREKARRQLLNQHFSTLLSFLELESSRRMEQTTILAETINLLNQLMETHIMLVQESRQLSQKLNGLLEQKEKKTKMEKRRKEYQIPKFRRESQESFLKMSNRSSIQSVDTRSNIDVDSPRLNDNFLKVITDGSQGMEIIKETTPKETQTGFRRRIGFRRQPEDLPLSKSDPTLGTMSRLKMPERDQYAVSDSKLSLVESRFTLDLENLGTGSSSAISPLQIDIDDFNTLPAAPPGTPEPVYPFSSTDMQI